MGLAELAQLSLAFALAAAGLGMIGYASVYLIRTITRGLVETSALVTNVEFDQFDDPSSYTVTLVFRYYVGDTEYTGRHLAFDVPGRLSPQDETRIAHYYPEGEYLKVFYHPDHPGRVQVDRDTDDALFFAFLLIPTGGLMVWLSVNWGARLISSPK
jgi:hypothetical protein